MVDILKEDNVKMEIPLVNRRIVELDIEGTQSASESKIPLDLLPKVAALNTIRSILNDDDLFTNIDFIEKFRAQKGLSILIEMCVGHLDFLANSKLAGHFEKAKIKQYLHSVLVTLNEEPKAGDITALLKANIFTKDEIAEIARLKLAEADNDAQVIELPAIATLNDWKMNETRSKYYFNRYLSANSMKLIELFICCRFSAGNRRGQTTDHFLYNGAHCTKIVGEIGQSSR